MFLLLLFAIPLAQARPQTDIGNSAKANGLSAGLLKLSRTEDIFNDALPEENLDHHPGYWEGDIILTKPQKDFYYGMSQKLTYKKALVKDPRKLWPNRRIPYVFAKHIDAEGRRIVRQAIRHWHRRAGRCLRFVRRRNERDYLRFVFLGGCASYVGRIGGKQILTIGSRALKCRKGNLIHELGHAIGFFHEHSRPDRSQYVRVVRKNVRTGFMRNFMRMTTRQVDSKQSPYDYGSIMHYPQNFFTKSPEKVTLQILKPTTAVVGQRVALSEEDVKQAKKLYGCRVRRKNRGKNRG